MVIKQDSKENTVQPRETSADKLFENLLCTTLPPSVFPCQQHQQDCNNDSQKCIILIKKKKKS